LELDVAARSSFNTLITRVKRLAISLSAVDDSFALISVIVCLHSRSSDLSASFDSFSEMFS
jgi:hypothetical protein